MTTPRYWLVVPAAGLGQRMQSTVPKQYLRINSRFVLDITLSRLRSALTLAGCVVPLHPEDRWWADSESASVAGIETCPGGTKRADSVMAALGQLQDRAGPDDWVLVHDVARPCVHPDDLANLIRSLAGESVGGLLAAPVADTLKQVAPGSDRVTSTVDRDSCWRAFTPQMFRYSVLLQALTESTRHGRGAVTDEASAIERLGWQPKVVAGRSDNIKITVPEDLALAEFILARQS